MLSSRPQHVLYTDKENAVSAAPSRKAGGLSAVGQANMLKTPGAKQHGLSHMHGASKTVKATSSKQSLESTQLKDRRLAGAATIALEPGARVLGAKDGNNRALQGARGGVQNGKGKGRAVDAVYDDCSLMPSKPAGTAKKSTQEALKSSKKAAVNFSSNAPLNIATAKTPARQTTRGRDSSEAQATAAAFKTPRIQAPSTIKRSSPASSSSIPSFSAFKTPSPNQLLRRRKGGGSPVPFHFNPTSLRLDGSEDQLDAKPPKPTLLEELDAYHATIDDTQEVDCATRQAVDPEDLPPDLPFEMPNYKEMDILGITFRATFPLVTSDFKDEPTPVSYDDSDMHARDYLYESEWVNEPLFPLENSKSVRTQAGATPQLQASRPAPSRVAGSHSKNSTSTTTIGRNLKGGTSIIRKPTGVPANRIMATSASTGARTKTTVKSSATQPRFRLTMSDLPEVIDFDLGEIDLLM